VLTIYEKGKIGLKQAFSFNLVFLQVDFGVKCDLDMFSWVSLYLILNISWCHRSY